MKAIIMYSDGETPKEIKEVKSLKALLKLSKEYEHPLIITNQVQTWDKQKFGKADFTIEVYNDYRE